MQARVKGGGGGQNYFVNDHKSLDKLAIAP